MPKFLNELYAEHRSIAAVLQAMRALLAARRDQGKRVDPAVFRAMLYYLDVFPEREHHPKEEQVLFAALRAKTHEADESLLILKREHEQGEQAIRALDQALVRYEAGGDREFESFAEHAERFVANYFEHMRREEHEVMPIAERVLTASDWAAVEAIFRANRDPLAGVPDGGTPEDYRALFSRIVALAPAPIGLGEPL